MLGGIIKILVIIAIVLGITRFIPKDVKQSVTAKLGGALGSIVPESVKQKIEPLTLSPAERRKKLLDQLTKNIESIKSGLKESLPGKTGDGASSTETETTQNESAEEEIANKLEESKKIIEEIEKINNEAGTANKITTKMIKTITGKNTETSETCSSENK